MAKINDFIYIEKNDERKNDTNMSKSLYKYGVLEKPCSNTKSKFLGLIRDECRTHAVSNQMRKFQYKIRLRTALYSRSMTDDLLLKLRFLYQ